MAALSFRCCCSKVSTSAHRNGGSKINHLPCSKVRNEMEDQMAVYGYARVSTEGQTLAAQLEQLKAAGAVKVFSEKISGASADNRKELQKALAALSSRDVLLVTRLDRLARSTLDLLTILNTIGRAGAGFRSLADVWADTTTAHGRLILTVLAGLAEFERELIKARTSDGRKRAKARGVHLGRPSALNRDQQREALARIAAGEAQSDIARTFGISRSSIARLKLKGPA
jgi:DNA invertase Pin-like site-specific DNA recombinase